MPKLAQSQRKNFWRIVAPLSLVLVLTLLVSAHAQWGGWGGGRGRFRRSSFDISPERAKEQEEMEKAINPNFQEDVFTFARLKFTPERGYGFGGGRIWDDDAPEADLNLIYRLFEVTSLKVRPGLH